MYIYTYRRAAHRAQDGRHLRDHGGAQGPVARGRVCGVCLFVMLLLIVHNSFLQLFGQTACNFTYNNDYVSCIALIHT